MEQSADKKSIIAQLKQEILALQGFQGSKSGDHCELGLGQIAEAFPSGIFPQRAVHEFISSSPSDAVATSAFITGLLSGLTQRKKGCLWISAGRKVYPPAITMFGIDPARIIFIDLANEKEVLWTVEQALKCRVLAAVVGELREIDFPQSQRLQLAVEKSGVTGIIHRYMPSRENTIACVSRWKVVASPSLTQQGMPGIGAPRWAVELLKVRNGTPGKWLVEWAEGRFSNIKAPVASLGVSLGNQRQGYA